MVRQDKEQTLKRKEKNKSSVSLSSCKCKNTFQGQWVHLFILKRLSGLRQAIIAVAKISMIRKQLHLICVVTMQFHIYSMWMKNIQREAFPKWCNAAPWQCLNINKGSDRFSHIANVSLLNHTKSWNACNQTSLFLSITGLHQAVRYYSQYSSHHIRNHSDTVNLN